MMCGRSENIYRQQAPFVIYFIDVFFSAGTPCRFDSSSISRGSCIFPCRCTEGCDQVTGQCLVGGQCIDGNPRGYTWSGPTCQIGVCAKRTKYLVTTLVHEEWVTYSKQCIAKGVLRDYD